MVKKLIAEKLVTNLMLHGKKSVSKKLISRIKAPIDIAVRNCAPKIIAKKSLHNVKQLQQTFGTTYEIKVLTNSQSISLAIKWIIEAARKRAGKTGIAKALIQELNDASRYQGSAYKKKIQAYQLVLSNKAIILATV